MSWNTIKACHRGPKGRNLGAALKIGALFVGFFGFYGVEFWHEMAIRR